MQHGNPGTIPQDQLQQLRDAAGGNTDVFNTACQKVQDGTPFIEVLAWTQAAAERARSGTTSAGGSTNR